MTLVTVLLVGLSVGYRIGMHRKAVVILNGAFLVALLFQSFVSPYLPGPHNIDLHDPGYWLTQPVILALGFGFIWLGTKIEGIRSRKLRTV